MLFLRNILMIWFFYRIVLGGWTERFCTDPCFIYTRQKYRWRHLGRIGFSLEPIGEPLFSRKWKSNKNEQACRPITTDDMPVFSRCRELCVLPQIRALYSSVPSDSAKPFWGFTTWNKLCRRDYSEANYYLFPFALLCVLQSIWQLESSVASPLLHAVTWSASISFSL